MLSPFNPLLSPYKVCCFVRRRVPIVSCFFGSLDADRVRMFTLQVANVLCDLRNFAVNIASQRARWLVLEYTLILMPLATKYTLGLSR